MKKFLVLLTLSIALLRIVPAQAQIGPAKFPTVTKISSTTASPFIELSDSVNSKSYLLRKAVISIAISGTTTGATYTITEVGTDRLINKGGVGGIRIVIPSVTTTTAAQKATAIRTWFLTP